VGFVVEKLLLGHFSQSSLVFPCQYHSTVATYHLADVQYAVQRYTDPIDMNNIIYCIPAISFASKNR